MSFGAREARETRIKADRRPRINLCGDCGAEVSETELLCEDCRCPNVTLDGGLAGPNNPIMRALRG